MLENSPTIPTFKQQNPYFRPTFVKCWVLLLPYFFIEGQPAFCINYCCKCYAQKNFLCPRHSKNGGGALSVTLSVRVFVRASVRPSVIKIKCPLNNFWKTASIRFKLGMLIYNIKTQVDFDFGYNPLIFYGVMGLL